MAPIVPNPHTGSERRKLARACAGWCAVAWLCLLPAGGARAQSKPSEYDVKAAYLLNFGKFMRFSDGWQPPGGAFNICILGLGPLAPRMDRMAADESIDGLPVHVQRIADPTQGRSCQIVYISPFEAARMREDLAILASQNALTVGDAPDFLELGGIIQFILQGDHVRFRVNLHAAERSHIVLSSELLRVAASIEGRPGGAR